MAAVCDVTMVCRLHRQIVLDVLLFCSKKGIKALTVLTLKKSKEKDCNEFEEGREKRSY